MLREFVLHGGEFLSHEYLLGRVWGLDYIDEHEYLRVYIRNLRQRLEPDPKHPIYLLSMPGTGYALKMPGDLPNSGASADGKNPGVHAPGD
ncbi:winged helix-turn-helix domain-containing protein [Sulfobacillus sp. DSM 109850]|uniref:Winged helix-turn-helix domain-containing protein n=1 Tax=Sulfobacillus harzensis TaxID=2729629 RepID=A0A7Y0L7D6_9FIRM|nr:winged helix-turn-helix domain-containing protein [Sulfobacillus harzensis]